MNKEIRHREILDYIQINKRATVTELANKFSITEATIRRDLNELSESQLIQRTRGGAVGIIYRYIEDEYDVRQVSHFTEKQSIARKALELVDDEDSIILDSGTTTYELAKLLHMKKDLTIIINDFNIYNILRGQPNIKLIFAGGVIIEEYNEISVGIPNKEFYSKYSVNKAFMGVMSVELDSGVYHSNMDVSYAKQGMVENAEQIILLVDHTKFESKSMYRITSMDNIDYIVTDSDFNEKLYDVPSHIKVMKAE